MRKTIYPIILFLSVFLFLAGNIYGQGLTKYATKIDGINADKIAVYIEDLRSGDVVLDVNGEEPLVPASITKVFSAATAFQKCDINSRYKTEIIADGPITDGVLKGNLVIMASGDPTIESEFFPKNKGVSDSIAKAIQKKGIREIQGRIIVNEPAYLNEPIPAGWVTEDVNWPYGAGHHALNYADNRFNLTYSGNGNYRVVPETPGVTFKQSSGKGSVWRARDSKVYNVNHGGARPLNVTLANPDPASSFVAAITNKLKSLSINIVDDEMKTGSKKNVIYTHYSPTLYEIMKSLILRSDNQMAEAMLRKAWPGKSRSEAAKLEMKHWEDAGVQTSDNFLEDGSGLSRSDRLTAYSMADLLAWMLDNDKNFIKFLNMFPKAGKSGTLKSFLKGTALEGKLWAKTGSMNGVQCYAGYAVDDLGMPTHIVVIMVNGFKGDRNTLKSRLGKLLLQHITLK